jgi:uncharacterized protein (DUF2249 family)
MLLYSMIILLLKVNHLLNGSEIDDGVLISIVNDDDPSYLNSFPKSDENEHNSKRMKRQAQDVIKSYINKLKKDQEMIISSGTGFVQGHRFKSGDIHISKQSRLVYKSI